MINDSNYLWVGTIVSISYEWEHEEQREEYMLVESVDSEYVFQLVCVSGDPRGRVMAYIRKDDVAVQNRAVAVTRAHLVAELVRLFGESVKILDIRPLRYTAGH